MSRRDLSTEVVIYSILKPLKEHLITKVLFGSYSILNRVMSTLKYGTNFMFVLRKNKNRLGYIIKFIKEKVRQFHSLQ